MGNLSRRVDMSFVVSLIILIGVIIMLFNVDFNPKPEIIRLDDGHQYIKYDGYEGSQIIHSEGCDHIKHK